MGVDQAEYPVFKDSGILLVDDDDGVLELLSATCKLAGFRQVFTAKNGIDALKVLQRHTDEIDLVSLDFMMPNLDGLRVAEIVANTHGRIVGLLMVTGYGSIELEEGFRAINSDVVLANKVFKKPFTQQGILKEYASVIGDVHAKREKQIEPTIASSLKQIRVALASNAIELSGIGETLVSLKRKLESVQETLKNLESSNQPKGTTDLSYVWALTVVFLLVAGGLTFTAGYFRIPILSVLALASFTILVLMLIAVFDLSKGGKLGEKSLMEVLRKAFAFIGKRRK